ncbi:MAG: pheST operon leader peptide PheM [Enterobacteriaceae bacterium]|nr:pheST operon leader peptide PheM [Enterobacteriaceae bacterium]
MNPAIFRFFFYFSF